MPASELPRNALIADAPADVAIETREVLAGGFRPYERVRARRAGDAVEVRDLLRAGPAVAVLPIDLEREEVVLIRQVRLAAQLANGKGDLVEIVAGHVGENEAPRETAQRECVEEIGIAPQLLVELFTYLTSPGMTDEEVTLFLGVVDASRAALAPDAREASAVMRVSIEAALGALSAGTVRNGPLVAALQWLALNRPRLADIARTGAASRQIRE
jgi:ADP-ribose pyrophosphatase